MGAGPSCSEARESSRPDLKLDTCLPGKTAEGQCCSRGLTVAQGEEDRGLSFPPAPLPCLYWDRGKGTPQTTEKGELKNPALPHRSDCDAGALAAPALYL